LLSEQHQSDLAPLSKQERHFYCVNFLRGSVSRSGFIGYFENSTYQDIADAYDGLEILDLQPVLSLFEKAKDIVLGNKHLPKEKSPVIVFPDSLTEEEYEEAANLMDKSLLPIQEEFYKYDEILYSALCEYADRHQLEPHSG